jgi:uncharacterized protein (TIGR03118 family)
MNRLSPPTMHRFGLGNSPRGRRRRASAALGRLGSSLEVLEDRTLLSLDLNNVENLTAVSISATQNVSITQDVATFNDTDSTAVASNFTASINWGDGSSTSAGTITEDASDLFHVSGTHIYTSPGSFAVTVTVKDVTNGTLYATDAFNQTNVVSSVAGMAGVTDASLINPWGTSSSSTSPIWVSDQGSGVSTLYNPNGSPIKEPLTVTIPAVGTPSGPTGQVFNADTTATDFTIPGPSGAVPSVFLFSSLDGTIAGWNPGSNGGSASALTAATVSGATFTGLAQASASGTYYLYATDFSGTTGTNGIDVFDPTFTNVSSTTFAGKFTDPGAVTGYHPYNIAFLNGDLFVAYAQPSGIVTTGGGYIDEFDTSGNFINRIYTDTAGTTLKGPWGMAIAPSGFGTFGGDLLVGSFGNATSTGGNGTISVISLATTPGTLVGTLTSPDGTIANAGLWSLLPGNGGSGGTAGTVYFTAGIDGQTQGLLGAIAFSPGGTATVAGLTASATQPTVSTTEGQVFSGPVASFTNTNPAATVSEYTYVLIDWGDGKPESAGTVSQPGGAGTPFIVSGTHVYADAGVNGGVGHYPITVNLTDQDGLTLTIANTAAVADVPIVITGAVNPSSISGQSTGTSDVTKDDQPDFYGTSEAFSAVTLYATPTSGGTALKIGTGVTQADGIWNIASVVALPSNSYTITATAIDQYGETTAGPVTIVPSLVVDTVGPVITALTFDRADATLTVTFQDNLSGMDMASVEDSAFYHLSAKPLANDVHVLPLVLPTSITVTPGATPTSPVVVTVVFQHGALLRGGSYTVVINSGSGNTGIEDNAENALSGNFYGTFPTGNGRPGGEFLAVINTFHNVVEPFIPAKDGYVPPSLAVIDPPQPAKSHAESGAKRKLHVQTALPQTPRVAVVRMPAKPASTGPGHSTRDQAIESLIAEATGKPRRQ